jgi:squalene-hopene/tetraprenyl-beta-curcumene cyclase
MTARPALRSVLPDSGEVRAFYEAYPKERWPQKKPSGFWTVVVGAGLAINDAQSTGQLSDTARGALDLMWTLQRPDGGWKWPDCNYAPWEIDDHYGATVAALAVGIAPGGYQATPQARAGLETLRTYFQNNPPKSLHHRAMLAWCSVRIDDIMSAEEREKTLAELLALQLADGGWSTASFLTDWRNLKLEEGRPLETKTSDGYGAGFVILLARELGVAPDDPRLQRGVEWILTHQRESGKWFTRSPVAYAGNRFSNSGSAFDILALQACGKLPAGIFGKHRAW